ncbi:MAG TPA: fumarate hydratase [Syntrophales bacterium]|nr:fumarate hydratase [Syntrophales bacterium]HOM08059.1 fumarate hydratase [Syntrophales bacterium]HON99817.1 fumarate hydratase [Syntrophales bacterium]HPC01466.1 fumarate hydratase [Syntrophales bacterium]HPQ07470.1 fumarate hydratase [Syntrophales bacterium]
MAAREIRSEEITAAVKRLFLEANTSLGDDVRRAVEAALPLETSPLGRHALEMILENDDVAKGCFLPLCQDTGLAIVFAEVGQDVRLVGAPFRDAVEEGVRQAYRDGHFRPSVCHPLTRENTKDNTPAVVHVEIVPGDRVRLAAMAKGGGSENAGSVTMMLPTAGLKGVKDHVVDVVRRAGPNPCPPVTVGVGIGGAVEEAALMAKKALLRPVGSVNPDPSLAALEGELLAEINALGIGPQGFGGRTTCLAVFLAVKPCHIASLPVAVCIQCHAARHREVVL